MSLFATPTTNNCTAQGIPPLLIMVSVKWRRLLSEGGLTPTPVQTMQFVTETTTFDATSTAASEKGILANLPSPPQSCQCPRSVTFGLPSDRTPLLYPFFHSSQEKLVQERSSGSVLGDWPSKTSEMVSCNWTSSWSSRCTIEPCCTRPQPTV